MTVEQILRQQQSLLNLELSDLAVGSAAESSLLSHINFAIDEIAKYGRWSWLFARATIDTVASADTVDLPSDFCALRPGDEPYIQGYGAALRYTDAAMISQLKAGSASTSGPPFNWNVVYSAATDRHQLLLYPTPSGVYTLTIPYLRRVLPVSARTDTPAIPAVMHGTLALGALAYTEELQERAQPGGRRAVFANALARDWAMYGSVVQGQDRGPMAKFDDAERGAPYGGYTVTVIPSA